MTTMSGQSDRPYCRSCGYLLVGLTESSKCPECGKPIVEVLVRDSFPGGRGYRYESATKILGLPLLSVASGEYAGERYGKPVGIIAIGDRPRGVIAMGGLPVGVFSFGGLARGVFSFGGCAIGIISFGGLSIGGLALGGVALGVYAFGGVVGVIVGGMGGTVFDLWPW
jgi:predicted RNA-binding Zn-ribbon protein involved in translation (DUF1610 family)